MAKTMGKVELLKKEKARFPPRRGQGKSENNIQHCEDGKRISFKSRKKAGEKEAEGDIRGNNTVSTLTRVKAHVIQRIY
ncbi:hypothetical protein OWV82_021675 [Melia azedarach]|uniref:Uncharacterized protein n=1 Tax=Melia azedarach TaxID=155640 RepID=A0ACC1X0B4_MELAZ|nr:hypothetical protein OWV82_021675 [Melia azedarach]